MPHLRTTVAALTAATIVALPLATATTADAVERPGPVIRLAVDWYGVAFSPNGDHARDRARVAFSLAERSEVIVKVRRTDQARTLVFKDRLGSVGRGDQTWVWNGKNRNGKVVGDSQYVATIVADQVREGGKKKAAHTAVYVDTRFDAPWAPRLSADTVYPNTASYAGDFVGLTLDNTPDDPMTTLGEVVETIKDAEGRVVSRGRPFQYHREDLLDFSMPLAFRGVDAKNHRLAAGTYELRFAVTDLAGNRGRTKSVTAHVSDTPLVQATGSVVVAPTAAAPTPGRTSRRGGEDIPPVPCGTVVPSEVYADPGAMSYRSSDACGGTWSQPSIATATGGVDLTAMLPPALAPRGLETSWVSMRGKPTVGGETDTASLYTFGGVTTSPVVTSAAVAGESVTTTPAISHPFEPPYFTDYVRSLTWTITTKGTDSYDVAAVTVSFTYLTPQK